MDTSEINGLLEKYLKGTSTQEENAMLETWYIRYENKSLADVADHARIEQLDRIRKQVAQYSAPAKTYKLWPRIAVAAAVAVVVLGVWFYSSKHQYAGIKTGSIAGVNDIAPGKNGATITLASGRVIQLNNAKTGVVIGGALKYSDGSDVRYSSGSSRIESGTGSSSGSLKGSQSSTGPVGVRSLTPAELLGADGKAQILTAQTARGQTYQFTLPDGTKVWLNADSKLEFASNFSNVKQRVVKLSGEGYFEVAKDKQHPFIVSSKGQHLTVLGTHFNVNSYADEGSTKTTLLEGSVRVSGSGQNDVILKPNQQSILSASQQIGVVQADVEQAMAWKNGIFIFDDENLESIMKKIARWYDVEIVYKDKPEPLRAFQGRITRNRNLSEVLKMVEFTGNVHFKIEGRKLIVTN